jgi:chemotaxis protein CheD
MKMYATDLPVIYLKPGEIYIAQEPAVVQTVLGSCVSVTIHNRRSGTGIISHSLLPSCMERGFCSRVCAEEHKYVECSIRRMIENLDSMNPRRRDIEVKVFGGADMFTSDTKNSGHLTVGKQNIEAALKILKNEGLNVSVSDVGGLQGRKICFYTHTGEVLLKRLRGSINSRAMIYHGRENFSVTGGTIKYA